MKKGPDLPTMRVELAGPCAIGISDGLWLGLPKRSGYRASVSGAYP